MTHQLDVARGRDTIARWCALAEARLEYLTELFETGRWRRYHSERGFLENIQEAKSAVRIWRDLSTREASRNNKVIDVSWLGRAATTQPPAQTLREQVRQPAAIAAEQRSVTSIVPDSDSFPVDDAPPTPAIDIVSDLTRDIAVAIAERYPQLRNAM